MIFKIVLFMLSFSVLGFVISVFALWLVERFGTRGSNLLKKNQPDNIILSRIPKNVDIERLGQIERSLPKLERVIIICDHIENPTGTLGKAVEYNFERRVKYVFLISNSQAKEEIEGYYQIYKAFAKIATHRSDNNIMERDLVEIQQLPYDWNDRPYIFYQMSHPKESQKLITIAFIGDQLKEGIANNYELVEPTSAHTIAKTVLAEAPKKIVEVSVDEFTEILPSLGYVDNRAPLKPS